MTTKEESEKWLNKFIKEHRDCFNWCRNKEYGDGLIVCDTIADLIGLVNDFIKNGTQIDAWCFDDDEVDEEEFKLHYENYTGKKIEPEKDVSFIQCCC